MTALLPEPFGPVMKVMWPFKGTAMCLWHMKSTHSMCVNVPPTSASGLGPLACSVEEDEADREEAESMACGLAGRFLKGGKED